MTLRRWLLAIAAWAAAVGATTLAIAVLCLAGRWSDQLGGACELWLLGPFLCWPLAAGLALLAHAMRMPQQSVPEDDRDPLMEDWDDSE